MTLYLGLEDGEGVEQLIGDHDELLLGGGKGLSVDAVVVASAGRHLVGDG